MKNRRRSFFAIRPSDALNINWQRLRNKTLRTVLTILGIGIGIAAVLFLVGMTFGLQKLIVDRVSDNQTLLTIDVVNNDETADVLPISDSLVSQIQAWTDVEQVSRVKSLTGELASGGNALKTQSAVFGVEDSYFTLSGRDVSVGSVLSSEDDAGQQAVISTATLKLLGYATSEAALGSPLSIDLLVPSTTASGGQDLSVYSLPHSLTVVGVIEDESNYIFIPLSNFDQVGYDPYYQLKVKAVSQDSVEGVKSRLTDLGYTAIALVDTLQQMNKVFAVTQVVFAVISLIALLIAAIGMFNTMTISLLEQTKEIGVMKAIGATNQAVRQMFLLEAVTMGLFGGLAGMALGYAEMAICNGLLNGVANVFGGSSINLFYVPSWFLVTIMVLSLIIGWLTGWYPSRRAASLNPLDALRYE